MNSVEITFPSYGLDYHIGIEYSVAQKSNLSNYYETKANAMHFLCGHFLVISFRIHVDMRAKLALNTTSCLHCKLIAYDGPNEKLPLIMKHNGTSRSHWIIASTFQIFVVLIEKIYQQEAIINYAPIFINPTVYNLSKDESYEINFDNRTYCPGHSLSSRLCVFRFHTSSDKVIRFYLNDLQFTGMYSVSHSAAGIAFFDLFNGTVGKVFELNSNVWSSKSSYFEIIGTGSVMHLVVFEYSFFSSIAISFSMSSPKCHTLLVSDDYISYSRFITLLNAEHNIFQINESSQALLEYSVCYKLQFIHIKQSLFTFNILFPDKTPIFMTFQTISLLPDPDLIRVGSVWACLGDIQGHPTYNIKNIEVPTPGFWKMIGLITYLQIKQCN